MSEQLYNRLCDAGFVVAAYRVIGNREGSFIAYAERGGERWNGHSPIGRDDAMRELYKALRAEGLLT